MPPSLEKIQLMSLLNNDSRHLIGLFSRLRRCSLIRSVSCGLWHACISHYHQGQTRVNIHLEGLIDAFCHDLIPEQWAKVRISAACTPPPTRPVSRLYCAAA